MNKRTTFLAIVATAGLAGLSCSGGSAGGNTGSGGTSSTGGAGVPGTGGTSTGGQTQTGGQSGTGTGGVVATGGATGSGGGPDVPGSGGRGGSVGTGGSTGGTGGASTGKGGSPGTGGAGTGGAVGTGGTAGTCTGAICNAKSFSDISAAHSVPTWLKGAKLGIGMHFMVATVPAYHNEWFIQHEYCNSAFATWTSQNFPAKSPLSGGPWGYKDFIPLFTCAKWSMPEVAHQATTAASWAALFKASGATFVNATAQHHDRFAMWDSSEPASIGSAGTWNAAKMGPMRDVVGELATAVRAQGMKFGVNNHIMYGYSFVYCGAGGTTPGNVGPNTPASVSDLYDPQYADFYGPPNPGCGSEAGDSQCNPSKAFCDD